MPAAFAIDGLIAVNNICMYVQTAVYPFEPEREKGEGAMREKKGEEGALLLLLQLRLLRLH